jgi:hypothetical protein
LSLTINTDQVITILNAIDSGLGTLQTAIRSITLEFLSVKRIALW